MKKQENTVKKFVTGLEGQPIQSDLSREFSEEEIGHMALEDGNDDTDFSQAQFMGIEDLKKLVTLKKKSKPSVYA